MDNRLTVEGGSVVLTAKEVAERLGVDASRVRQLCIEGRFPGSFVVANRRFIPESAIEAYLENPDKRKRKEAQA